MKFYLEHVLEDEIENKLCHFYAVAFTNAIYSPERNKISAELVIYFSPTEGYSRFSLHTFSNNDSLLHYSRGPDYTNSVEAMLISLSLPLYGIPLNVWSLIPRDKCTNFFNKKHETEYLQARKDFAKALYPIRIGSSPIHGVQIDPFYGPPNQSWPKMSLFDSTIENEELMYSHV